MKRIVAGITSLEQHLQTMRESPEVYRPAACPHCGIKIVWVHGLYHRKADLCHRGEASLNPVPILRYCCSACRRTCSRLPECIAPRRWYNWFLQQIGLRAVLDPTQAAAAAGGPTPALRTQRRWRQWLEERGVVFRFFLASRFPELARAGEDTEFWLGVFATLGLSGAMAWLDAEMDVP